MSINVKFNDLLNKNVFFKASRRARKIRICVGSDLVVNVVYPANSSRSKAEEFLNDKINWVEKTIYKMNSKVKVNHFINNNLSSVEIINRNAFLIRRCRELAKKYNFKVGKITLRNQKTLWGSCSSNNNISLNRKLIFLDYDMMEYVICHELVHTEIKNHSKLFWNKLESILPKAGDLDKKLKQYKL